MKEHVSVQEILINQEIVIRELRERSIPISPENYALWYRYTSGKDIELNDIIASMIEKQEPFTQGTLHKLFEQFCEEISSEELQRLREELQSMVTTLFRNVDEFVGESDGYGEMLLESVENMSKAESVHEINDIVASIVKKTKTFGEKSKAVSSNLDSVQTELADLKKTLTALQEEIRHDTLTGIPNRKAFDETIERQLSLANRQKRTFSVLMVDIDFFKRVNDTYGHLIGDEVLQFVAQSIEARLRKEDMVSRFGGEEFVVILPETNREGAVLVAEQLRSHFSHTHMKREIAQTKVGKVTISIGVTEYRPKETLKDLLTRADYALYSAKENGRDQVCWK